LYYRLQHVTTLFSEQRAIRFKHSDEAKNGYLRLPPINPARIRTPANWEKDTTPIEEELELDEEEKALLEEQNIALKTELETLVDHARVIEQRVMEISHLQQVFAMKVSEQLADIEHNRELVISSKANIDAGAKQIREATKFTVDFRFFVLLFLIIASLALLFLHWFHN